MQWNRVSLSRNPQCVLCFGNALGVFLSLRVGRSGGQLLRSPAAAVVAGSTERY